MKPKILILSFLLTLSMVLTGCQQVAHETHETVMTETIVSQEIVVE